MNFRFSNLLGAPYRGGNLIIHDNELLTPVGNRVGQVDLVHSTSQTLPFENLKQIQTLCVSPDGSLLLSVDEDGRALLINRKRRALLHHFSFKGKVSVAKFSPDGQYLAAGVGRLVQVEGRELPVLCTLSRDGAFFTWTFTPSQMLGGNKQQQGTTVVVGGGPQPKKQKLADGGAAHEIEAQRAAAKAAAAQAGEEEGEEAGGEEPDVMPFLAGGKWSCASKDYVAQRGARVSCAAYHPGNSLLVAGLTSGLFDIYQLPGWENIQWRSDSYVLKQQGHYHDISTTAFSPDGALVATGSDDRKVKLFQLSSGFCFITFAEHTAPVTSVAFLPSGQALVSASLDGTIYVWSVRTGRLLDVLAGHEGPVSQLAFSPGGGPATLLASASWDKTVRTWDVFSGRGSVESLPHNHDVLALAFAPNGKQLAAATLNGDITFWDPHEAILVPHMVTHNGGHAGGGNTPSRAICFLSCANVEVTYCSSLTSGSSRYVVIYDVVERVMLRRFAVTNNKSLDGVLDVLNSKHVTDAGPLALIDNEGDADDADLLPATLDAAAAADVPGTGTAKKRPLARTSCVALSPTGRCWVAATTEGLVLYSLGDDLLFDPTDLTEDLTPAACRKALAAGAYVRAALIALRLGDQQLLAQCIFTTPQAQVSTVAAALPVAFIPQLITALSDHLQQSAHLEFVLRWCHAVCVAHGPTLEAAAGGVGRAAAAASAALPALRSLQKALTRAHEDLAAAAEANVYTLEYLFMAGQAEQAAVDTQTHAHKSVDSGGGSEAEGKEQKRGSIEGRKGRKEQPEGEFGEDTAGHQGEGAGNEEEMRSSDDKEDDDDGEANGMGENGAMPLVSIKRIGGSRQEGDIEEGTGEEESEDGAGDEEEESESADEEGSMPGWG
ncbi:WD40 repeat-like protein [Dunaliella salina]|uniref:WD40 repeat-like protein n=1 Tax=Dunaliella salina TaxID=3046 RepID=A0ABQ7GUP0_DUNSA|nr:WD40 repeat-like protein [Dunaliella salina]|eukprot:KAF5838324.1 WD40 repeat-like protein [Dunaliella salina]